MFSLLITQPRIVGDRECFSVLERQLVSLRMEVSFSTHFPLTCYSESMVDRDKKLSTILFSLASQLETIKNGQATKGIILNEHFTDSVVEARTIAERHDAKKHFEAVVRRIWRDIVDEKTSWMDVQFKIEWNVYGQCMLLLSK